MRRVLTWCAPYKRQLIGFIAVVVIDAVVMVIPPLLVRTLIDTALPDKNRNLVAIIAVVRRRPRVRRRDALARSSATSRRASVRG